MLFAFESDLKGKKASEFKRYETYENAPVGMRSIDAMCIVGRGMWSYSFPKNKYWGFQEATKQYDEVISMLYALCNSLPVILASRGQPLYGYYIHNGKENRAVN